jgi:DNA polymerase-3 subunit delta
VVIVKEAQDLSRTIDKLESYAENPCLLPFWFCYKYKTLDKRKDNQSTRKNGLVTKAKTIWEPSWRLDKTDISQ